MRLTAGLAFIIMALCFSVILNVLFFSKEHINTRETKIFSIIVFINLIGLIVELFCVLCINYLGVDNAISIFVNRLYLVYLLSFILVFASYVLNAAELGKDEITYFDEKVFKFLRIFMYVLFIFSFIFVWLLDINLYGESGYAYSYGDSVNLVYFMCGICVFGCLFYIIRNLGRLRNSSRNIPIVSFLIFVGIITYLQKTHPELTVATALETLIIFIMFHTIENPDVKMIEQLEIAKDQADKANKAKTDFLSSMSHEIRTPLNAIVGFSDCIMDTDDIKEAKSNAKDIVDASNTLLEIVNGILDISKIEAGKLEILNSSYDAKETFTSLARLITPRMKEKELDFTYYIAPDIPDVLFGDHTNIKKIVTNLLSNACKYTEKGFVRYEVNCVNTDDISRLIISVEDSGRGIKSDNVDKMFTKFKRLEEDKNTTIEGTGLGLAISKQLTELMGGKIVVRTEYGKGSKFTVIINQKIDKSSLNNKKKYKTTLDLHDLRILVVDDAPLNLKVTSKLLEKYNANNISTCTSGFECIEKIEGGEVFDIILLDDMMPKMTGVETLKKLKQIEGFNMPVVALTANAITSMKEKYISEGFDNYLPKPVNKNDLIKVINEILERTVTVQDSVADEDITVRSKEEINEVIPVPDDIENKLEKKVEISNDVVDINTDEYIENREALDNNEIGSSYLEENGVDLYYALELLGDMDMYNSTIKGFLDDADDKWDRIVNYYDARDMENYAIEVHSLKSDSKYLGFMKLADIAYQHELKSKENDFEYVDSHFSELENEYKRCLKVMSEYVNSN